MSTATVGRRGAPRGVQVLLVIYTVVVGVFAVGSGIWAWRVAERAAAAEGALEVRYLTWGFSVSAESSIFLVVIVFGIMGSIVHVATSLASYIGNDRFRASWAVWYLLRPVIAAVLAMIAYATFRAGFFSTQAPADNVNLFGIAAISALAGIFSKQVTDKLEDVMNVVFASKRNEERGDKLQTPMISRVTPQMAPANTSVTVTVEGSAFGAGATVLIGEQGRTPASQSGDLLTIELAASDLPESGQTLELRVRNVSGETSEPFMLTVT